MLPGGVRFRSGRRDSGRRVEWAQEKGGSSTEERNCQFECYCGLGATLDHYQVRNYLILLYVINFTDNLLFLWIGIWLFSQMWSKRSNALWKQFWKRSRLWDSNGKLKVPRISMPLCDFVFGISKDFVSGSFVEVIIRPYPRNDSTRNPWKWWKSPRGSGSSSVPKLKATCVLSSW